MRITCQNAGCVGDKEFEFSDDEAEWYAERGLSEPKNCPPCRNWIKSEKKRGDMVIRCSICDGPRIVTAGQRIMHHKHDGSWADPTLCRLCERDPERARSLALLASGRDLFDSRETLSHWERQALGRRRAKLGRDDLERVMLSEHGSAYTPITSIDILDDPDAYKQIHHPGEGSYYAHIMHDVVRANGTTHKGHGDDLKQALDIPSSRMDGEFDPSSDRALFGYLRELCSMESPERIAEFRDKARNDIVKYDKETGVAIITSPLRNGPPDYHVRTSFVMDPGQAARNIRGGRDAKWQPVPIGEEQ